MLHKRVSYTTLFVVWQGDFVLNFLSSLPASVCPKFLTYSLSVHLCGKLNDDEGWNVRGIEKSNVSWIHLTTTLPRPLPQEFQGGMTIQIPQISLQPSYNLNIITLTLRRWFRRHKDETICVANSFLNVTFSSRSAVWRIRRISPSEENVLMLAPPSWIPWSLRMSPMASPSYILGVSWDIDETLTRLWRDVDGHSYLYVPWMGLGGRYPGDMTDRLLRDDDPNSGVHIM